MDAPTQNRFELVAILREPCFASLRDPDGACGQSGSPLTTMVDGRTLQARRVITPQCCRDVSNRERPEPAPWWGEDVP
jgi:hypothetical protein